MTAMRAHEAGAAHADATDPGATLSRAPDDVNALDPLVWPSSLRRRADGVVELAGHDVRDLATALGFRPTYVRLHRTVGPT